MNQLKFDQSVFFWKVDLSSLKEKQIKQQKYKNIVTKWNAIEFSYLVDLKWIVGFVPAILPLVLLNCIIVF